MDLVLLLKIHHFVFQVITWLQSHGGQIAERYSNLADNLKAIRSQQKDFEKFHFSAMVRNLSLFFFIHVCGCMSFLWFKFVFLYSCLYVQKTVFTWYKPIKLWFKYSWHKNEIIPSKGTTRCWCSAAMTAPFRWTPEYPPPPRCLTSILLYSILSIQKKTILNGKKQVNSYNYKKNVFQT